MCEPTTLMMMGIGLAAASGGVAAYGQYQQGKTAQQVANNNAVVAEYQAQDAQNRGEQEAQRANRAARQQIGAMRTIGAARGLDISEGTVGDLIDQADFFGQQDVSLARLNAAKEAWNARAQKAGYQAEASASRFGGNMGAAASLLGAASTVASGWYSYKNPPKPRG